MRVVLVSLLVVELLLTLVDCSALHSIQKEDPKESTWFLLPLLRLFQRQLLKLTVTPERQKTTIIESQLSSPPTQTPPSLPRHW